MLKNSFYLSSALIFLLSACQNSPDLSGDSSAPLSREDQRKRTFGNVLGDEFLNFGGKKSQQGEGGSGYSNVNPCLWRASLETIRFMPLVSSDAAGGVIVTDWYSSPQTPNERIKVTIFITNYQLRADAIQVDIFKQNRKGDSWVSVNVDKKVKTDMEDLILSTARKIHIKNVQQNS